MVMCVCVLYPYSLRKGDEHPTYTPHGVWHTILYFTIPVQLVSFHDDMHCKHSSASRENPAVGSAAQQWVGTVARHH